MFELLILAIAPGLFFLWFFWSRDKYEREPLRLLVITFALGAASIAPTIALEKLGGLALPESHRATSMISLLLYYFLIVGLVEETMKCLATWARAYRSTHFNEVMDGVVYSTAAALGFATVENVLYVLGGGLGTGIARAILSVPGHALDSSLFGYFLGLAKFQEHRRGITVGKGLLLAILFHGSWDFLLKVHFLLALAIYVAEWVIVMRLIRKAEMRSPFGTRVHPAILPVVTQRSASTLAPVAGTASQGPSVQPTKQAVISPSVSYCLSCGFQISDDSDFCTNCGAKRIE